MSKVKVPKDLRIGIQEIIYGAAVIIFGTMAVVAVIARAYDMQYDWRLFFVLLGALVIAAAAGLFLMFRLALR